MSRPINSSGDRVTTDLLAMPFSMGRNLLCIFSKKHVDNPPELKSTKQRRDLAARQPRGSREMAERRPRGGRETAERQPRGGRETAERQPGYLQPRYGERYSRDTAEVQPRYKVRRGETAAR